MNKKDKLIETTTTMLQNKLNEDMDKEYKVKDFKRYPNGSEVDIILGTFEDGRQFMMLADSTTGISVYKKGFDVITIEDDILTNNFEDYLDNSEAYDELLGENMEEFIDPRVDTDKFNKVVSQIDKHLMV